jgi:hypothetical protein
MKMAKLRLMKRFIAAYNRPTTTGDRIAMKTQEAHVGGTIGEMIVHGIDRYPDRVAFIDGDARMTYRALGDRISQAIAAFRALGLVRGDCVVQLSGNRPEVFVVMAAAYLMGLRSVTLHAMGVSTITLISSTTPKHVCSWPIPSTPSARWHCASAARGGALVRSCRRAGVAIVLGPGGIVRAGTAGA